MELLAADMLVDTCYSCSDMYMPEMLSAITLFTIIIIKLKRL